MPYADPASRRKAQRESQRRRRARLRGDTPPVLLAAGCQPRQPQERAGEVEARLWRLWDAVMAEGIAPSEAARVVVPLARALLQVLEQTDLAVRVRNLENAVEAWEMRHAAKN